MREVTCESCGGTGKARLGTMVGPVDPDYDWHQHSTYPCDTPEQREARGEAWRDLMTSLKPGDTVTSSGQFDRKVREAGMYDGWPFWKPTPAVSYIGPLGGLEYDFFYNLSRAR